MENTAKNIIHHEKTFLRHTIGLCITASMSANKLPNSNAASMIEMTYLKLKRRKKKLVLSKMVPFYNGFQSVTVIKKQTRHTQILYCPAIDATLI